MQIFKMDKKGEFMKAIITSLALFSSLMTLDAYAEYPVLHSTMNRCKVEIRASPSYGTGAPMSYPIKYQGKVNQGDIFQDVEGARMCVRTAPDCNNLATSFFCVSASKDLNAGAPVSGDF